MSSTNVARLFCIALSLSALPLLAYANNANTSNRWYHKHLAVGGDLSFLNQNTEGTIYSGKTNLGLTHSGALVRITAKPKLSGGTHINYHFDNGYDMDMSYDVNHHHLYDAYGDGGSAILYPSATLIPPKWGLITYALDSNSTLRYKQKVLNITFGRWYLGSHNLNIHPIAGLAFSQLSHDQFTVYANLNGAYASGGSITNSLSNPSTINANVTQKSTVRGIGPEFGLDARYHLTNRIKLLTQVHMAVFVGNMRSLYHGLKPDDESSVLYPSSKIEDKTKQSVFEMLDLFVGPSYELKGFKDTLLKVSLGYRINEFIHGMAANSAVDDYANGALSSLFKDASTVGPELRLSLSL